MCMDLSATGAWNFHSLLLILILFIHFLHCWKGLVENVCVLRRECDENLLY